ncbi:uncharacterized protein LOC135483979 [Lineus longissimus]|uniref:uncharacterized protein LOC135483979 n=1 Tax=Lineus longissimus TaxID=88925 RepID=UPI00315DB0D2
MSEDSLLSMTDNRTDGINEQGVFRLMEVIYTVLSKYVWMLPVVFGIPGNMISVVVTTREHNRHLSPCIYMSAMALVDTLLLVNTAWFVPIIFWNLAQDASLKARGLMFKFAWYITYTCAILSGLYLAEMSTDRLIAVRFPMAAPRLCTTSRAHKTVIITTILIAALDLNIFFTYQYIRDPVTGSEILLASFPSAPVVELLASGFQLIFGTICPFIVILFSNTWIILAVRKAAKERTKMGTSEKHGAKAEKDTAHLTRMLILTEARNPAINIWQGYQALMPPHHAFVNASIPTKVIAARRTYHGLTWSQSGSKSE